MDAQASNSPSISREVKIEVSRLKAHVLSKADLSHEDRQVMLGWLDCLQASPFGAFLILNKKIDGSPAAYCQAAMHPVDKLLFASFPALAAMQQRFSILKGVLAKFLLKKMMLGVFPASYVGEWSFLHETVGASVVALGDKPELMRSAASFDVIIRNTFLYGDQSYDDDPYACLFAGLKPGGVLLTSTWTAPDNPHDPAMRLEALVFEQLFGMRRCAYHAVSGIKTRLRQVGFENVQLLGGDSGHLRSIIARKPAAADVPLKTKRTIAHTPRRISRRGVCFKVFFSALAQ